MPTLWGRVMRTLLLGCAYFSAVLGGVFLLAPAVASGMPRCPQAPFYYYIVGVGLALAAVVFFALQGAYRD